MCASGGKKCSFYGKFGVLCFLETPVLKFALLAYYRRFVLHENLYPLFSHQFTTPCYGSGGLSLMFRKMFKKLLLFWCFYWVYIEKFIVSKFCISLHDIIPIFQRFFTILFLEAAKKRYFKRMLVSKSKQFCNPLIVSKSKQFCNPLMADGNKRSYVLKQTCS